MGNMIQLTSTTPAPPVASLAEEELSLPSGMMDLVREMSAIQQEDRRRHADAASRVRRRAAQLLATYRRDRSDADTLALAALANATANLQGTAFPICL